MAFLAKTNGLNPISTVTKKTNILVVPDNGYTSIKEKKAIKYNIDIITQEEFLNGYVRQYDLFNTFC